MVICTRAAPLRRVLGRPTLRSTPTPRNALESSPASAAATAAVMAGFSTARPAAAQNRIYTSVRFPEEFHSYQLLSGSARRPLITLWTTSWCATCKTVAPALRKLIEDGAGEAAGGVAFCEVDFDAPDIMSSPTGRDYMITSIPTLLPFDGETPLHEAKLADAHKMADPVYMRSWIENVAAKYGGGGDGSLGKGMLGGLFGSR